MSSRGLPEVLMQKVDEYVDSLAPQIQPRIATELEDFQQKTIDSLETQVVDAFRSLFNDNNDRPSSREGGGSSRNLSDSAPDAYGGQSLPFADEIAKLTRGFGQISDEAGGDLREIFALTQSGGGGGGSASRGVGGGQEGFDFSSGARGFLSSALDAVQDSLGDQRGSKGGQSFEIGGLLGMLSGTIKEASRNPEEKARMISPEIKQMVGEKLRSQHAPIAEQFTRIALEHIKRWLRGNTSSRDLGEGAKAEIAEQVGDLVKGLGSLFGNKKGNHESSARGFDEGGSRDGEGGGGGFSRVISDKLSTGLAKVHREVRIEFRKILGQIEKQLFELLPDQFQRPLEKILGGNPFDEQLDRDASANADRGFGDDIKAKLLGKIRDLVRKVQETLRQSILGVVNGGHRRFERQSWVFVQSMVEQKVQRYLPDVKINVPDDIGNENVSVGSPVQQLGGGNAGQQYQPPPPQHHQQQQQSYDGPPPTYNNNNNSNEPPSQQHQYHNEQQYQGPPHNQQYPPPPSQDYRPDNNQSYSQYPPPQHSSYPPPPPQQQQQQHQQQGYHQQGYQQQGYHQQQQGYPPRDYRDNNDEGYQRHGY